MVFGLIGAILVGRNDESVVSRRNISIEALADLGDEQTAKATRATRPGATPLGPSTRCCPTAWGTTKLRDRNRTEAAILLQARKAGAC